LAADPRQFININPDAAGGICFAVKVVPGAKRERVVGPHGGALKVMVAQPPEGGAANRAVCRLLAGLLGVAARDVQIVQGPASSWKMVRVSGLGLDQARQRLDQLAGGPG
jgi:uncharacterized protein (TIGR00251 family)